MSGRERAAWRAAAAARGLDLSELVRDAVRTRLAGDERRRAVVEVADAAGPRDARAAE